MLARGIDIHTHIVPDRFPAYAGTHIEVPWPSVRHTTCGHAQVIISGKVYREITDHCWNGEKRIGDMDRTGIACQALSPMPELLSYWIPAEDALVICRWLNETIAAMVASSPGRFVGLGMVPLQAPDMAARTLESALTDLGLKGVEIGTHVNGRPIGDPMFDEFFAVAEELGAAIFVHPLHPAGRERLVGPPMLEQVVAFPCETALSIASVITSGLLYRRPRLRLAFSHGGGAFGLVLPRLQFAWSKFPALADTVPVAPREVARKLYYDTLVYDETTLRFLLQIFGERQLIMGSDYPFSICDSDPCGRIGGLGLNEEISERLLYRNAADFLSL